MVVFLACATAAPAAAQESRGFQPQEASESGESKVALVIGNGAYEWSPLRNPVNDARSMSETLRDLGFKVIHATDATHEGMKRAIREFGSDLRRADVGLFYYAGHGIQASGRNYLIPVNAVINSEPEVEYESVDLGFVVAQMEAAGSPLNIVILDACRNNPFAGSFRSADRGLTQVMAPTGTLIAYATAPGSVASDGDGDNGLYTQELLRFMKMPGLDVEDVFKQVRISLINQTNGQQTPWESSSLIGEFSFAPEPPPAAQEVAQAPPQSSPAAQPVAETAPETSQQIPEKAPDPTVKQAAAPPDTTVQQPVTELVTRPATQPATQPVERTATDGAPVAAAPPAEAEVTDALEACIGILKDGDAELFDQYFENETEPGSLKNLREWIEKATGRDAELGRRAPSVDLVDPMTTAILRADAELSWRHSFGGKRSKDIPLEVVLERINHRWRLSACGVAGEVKSLR